MTPDSGRRKVCGGTWYHRAHNVRAAHRDDLSTTRWDTDIGFRTFRSVRMTNPEKYRKTRPPSSGA